MLHNSVLIFLLSEKDTFVGFANYFSMVIKVKFPADMEVYETNFGSNEVMVGKRRIWLMKKEMQS